MTLQQLRYAVTISETGSFNKAAEVLYVSQPSLTNAIKDLEAELGISVFYRSGKGAALTGDGTEFIGYARQVLSQYETLQEKYGKAGNRKKKFGVSAQHYSYAVKAFVEMVKASDTTKYEFAMRETKTHDVIDDVHSMRSEVGVLYLSDFNRSAIRKLLRASNLEYHKLADCRAVVYLWKHHPLAGEKVIRFEQLAEYPCIAFEQGENASFYLSEELLSTAEYPRTVKVCDRATVLNLMVGLNGYTLCAVNICEELNGDDYVAVPFETDALNPEAAMEIGYIVRRDTVLSKMGNRYIEEIKRYLHSEE